MRRGSTQASQNVPFPFCRKVRATFDFILQVSFFQKMQDQPPPATMSEPRLPFIPEEVNCLKSALALVIITRKYKARLSNSPSHHDALSMHQTPQWDPHWWMAAGSRDQDHQDWSVIQPHLDHMMSIALKEEARMPGIASYVACKLQQEMEKERQNDNRVAESSSSLVVQWIHSWISDDDRMNTASAKLWSFIVREATADFLVKLVMARTADEILLSLEVDKVSKVKTSVYRLEMLQNMIMDLNSVDYILERFSKYSVPTRDLESNAYHYDIMAGSNRKCVGTLLLLRWAINHFVKQLVTVKSQLQA